MRMYSISSNSEQSSKSPFIGNLSAFQRSSQEKPDLLKGSFGGSSSTLRKQASVTNIKNESGTLTGGSTLGDRTARYKVSKTPFYVDQPNVVQ